MTRKIRDGKGLIGQGNVVLEIDDNGNIYTPGAFNSRDYVGRVDESGAVYKGMGIYETYVGRVDSNGNIYDDKAFGGTYVGRVDEQGVLRDNSALGGKPTGGLGLGMSKSSVGSGSYGGSGGSFTGSGGTVLFFAIIIVGGLIYLSLGSIPEHLHNMTVIGEDEFYLVTIPIIVDLIAFLIALFSGSIGKSAGTGVLMTLILEVMMGMILFAATDAVVLIVFYIIERSCSILELIILYIGTLIMYLTTYLVVLVPGAIAGAIVGGLIDIKSKK